LSSNPQDRQATGTSNSMEQRAVDIGRQIELVVDQQVESGVALVRARHGDRVCDFALVASPLVQRFPACLCGEIDAMLAEESILLGDCGDIRKSPKSVLEIADGCACLDAGAFVNLA
jgi:hypothetical protein